jgi:transposase
MEACVGAHHLSRQLLALGHDVKLVPGQFVKPFLKGQKNDFRDAEAVAEAVQRPTMRFVPTKSVDQLDLQALHRVRSRLVSEVLPSAKACASYAMRSPTSSLTAPMC